MPSAAKSKPRLGRGLDALLPPAKTTAHESPRELDVDELQPRPDQPRRAFDQANLEELASSIRSYGVLEPILARPMPGGVFEIVAGERRWRAAQLAGLTRVPVVIRELRDQEAFEIALVENIQRESLNPVETALALRRLTTDFGYSLEALSKRVGKDRSTLSNQLRLLKLPEKVLTMIASGDISEGHGRALLMVPTPGAQQRLAQRAAQLQWTVRHIEEEARRSKAALAPNSAPVAKARASMISPNTRAVVKRLEEATGCTAQLKAKNDGSGTLSLSYHSLTQLDELIDRLSGKQR